jgi:hypothetical protein
VLEGMGFASFIRAAAEQTERLDRLFPHGSESRLMVI